MEGDALDVTLEVLLDRGIDLDDGTEDRLVELQRLDVAARANGGRSVSVLEEGDLAEVVAGPQAPERHLLATVSPPEHPGRAGNDHVEGIRLVAFGHDHLAEPVRDGNKRLDDEPARLVGKQLQDREAFENGRGVLGQLLRDAHATAPGF